ncbi:MAG TPA: chemotaxis protein CheE [Brevundimonas sp.]|nr:chemotaxis protein CheE [Brevundimonas sp.]
MTVITHSRRQSRLAKLIDSAGGVTVGVALTRARENIAALRDRGVEEIACRLEELSAVRPPSDPEEITRTLQQVYRSANHLIDAAAPFGFEELCAVAISLCDVVDRVGDDASPDWRIIDVHIQSLRLLNGLPADAAEERRQVLDHLSRMVARKLGEPG